MDFRLYKKPYHDPLVGNKIRLLFELEKEAENIVHPVNDVYLYLWVENGSRCVGFQLIYNEQYVIDFHQPQQVDFVKITEKPFDRSMREPIGRVEKEQLLSVLDSFSNAQFPDALAKIHGVIHGLPATSFDLTEHEMKLLATLDL